MTQMYPTTNRAHLIKTSLKASVREQTTSQMMFNAALARMQLKRMTTILT